MPEASIIFPGCPDFEWDLPNGRSKFWTPAHYTNFTPGDSDWYRGPRDILGAVYHTPEEKADDTEATPGYFQVPKVYASTDWYLDNDGDLFQCVRLTDFSWAQGQRTWNTRSPRPSYLPKDDTSYNRYYTSIEIEGYAESLARTMTPAQYDTLVEWSARMAIMFDYPVNRQRLIAHSELITTKRDPGPSVLVDKFISEVQSRVTELTRGTPTTNTEVGPSTHYHTIPILGWKTSNNIPE